MIEQHYLDDALRQLREVKIQADKALAQTTDEQGCDAGSESNSIAIIMKHMAGNMESRWTDFLTSDGEKPNRDRDREFELSPGRHRESLIAQWERGWATLFDAVSSLTAVDLGKTVRMSRRSTFGSRSDQPSDVALCGARRPDVMLATHYAARAGRRSASPRKSREVDVSKNGGP